MKIELNRKYVSGLIADTDLHAGGLFFCIIYQNCLEFFENGKVEFTKKLTDAFKPMDDEDIRCIENYKISGKYLFNDRGYLVCEFEDIFLKLTGLSTKKDPTILPFHAFNSRLFSTWSEVYQLESSNL